MYSMIQVTIHNPPLNPIKLRNQSSIKTKQIIIRLPLPLSIKTKPILILQPPPSWIKTPPRLLKITRLSWYNPSPLLRSNPIPTKPKPTGGLPFQKLWKDGAHPPGLVPSAPSPVPGSIIPNSAGCMPPMERAETSGYGIRNLAGSGPLTVYFPTSLTTLLPIGFTS